MSSQKQSKQDVLRLIPSVDEVLQWLAEKKEKVDSTSQNTPKRLILQAVRAVLEEQRAAILAGEEVQKKSLEREKIVGRVMKKLVRLLRPNFRTVINATGVVIHTNLGRSVLPPQTMQMLLNAGSCYSNLEMDLNTGKRGSRYSLVEEILCDLTGAEAGLVVNNNAAAVLLVLDTLAKGKEVIVSRGQLVEIGGSFRIPDVMARSGARLVEVGATNRTHLRDYENAIGEETSLLLKVHTSNYKIIGFTSEVPLIEMVALGAKHGLPVMEDLGSGCLIDLSAFGLQKEPTVGEVIGSGVDVVTFSGDKLLGGPQAGIIVGKKRIIDTIKKNPLNRALRIDKFTLAALESILRLYYDDQQAMENVPTLAMLAASKETLKRRAEKVLRRVGKKIKKRCTASLAPTESRVGGGALPDQAIPSWAVSLRPLDRSVAELERNLRLAENAVIGRIDNDLYILDMRTVQDGEIGVLSDLLCTLLGDEG
jgi:L-seryl-tRNA(Ser) seleniumtransferase